MAWNNHFFPPHWTSNFIAPFFLDFCYKFDLFCPCFSWKSAHFFSYFFLNISPGDFSTLQCRVCYAHGRKPCILCLAHGAETSLQEPNKSKICYFFQLKKKNYWNHQVVRSLYDLFDQFLEELFWVWVPLK